MNSEEMVGLAGAAIAEFQRHNNCSCFLCVENSAVHCRPLKKFELHPDEELIITQLQQIKGLTSGQWTAIGTTLFNQYNREVACRVHLKP